MPDIIGSIGVNAPMPPIASELGLEDVRGRAVQAVGDVLAAGEQDPAVREARRRVVNAVRPSVGKDIMAQRHGVEDLGLERGRGRSRCSKPPAIRILPEGSRVAVWPRRGKFSCGLLRSVKRLARGSKISIEPSCVDPVGPPVSPPMITTLFEGIQVAVCPRRATFMLPPIVEAIESGCGVKQ